tara:strand:+ start:1511 stop:4888 length:3378 start_codon:yes stop_codon:yes gene_type:complete
MAEAVIPTKESTDPGTSQSGDDVYLKQMQGSPFGGSAGDAMNAFLEGLSAFGAEFSRISDTLIQFFQATKMFLQAFKNPLTAALIETIDALIEALEELDRMGFGNLSVWPWQHGTYPAMLDTSKLNSAITSLVAAMEGTPASSLGYSESGAFVKTVNGEALLTPDQEVYRVKRDGDPGGLTKRAIYDALQGIRNFFHPETWKGTSMFYTEEGSTANKITDAVKDSLADSIDFMQKHMFVRELPPKEVVDKILMSLSGNSPDSNKPVGTGPYKAFMIMFALPTINGTVGILQSFVDYFAGTIGDELILGLLGEVKPDEKEETITLGEPLWKPSGLKDALDRFTDAGGRNWPWESREEWYYELSDFKVRPNLIDGKYTDGKHENKIDKIPMFKPGDKIIQEGGVLGFSSFNAEVINHLPILIQNGMILQNSVRVKGVRGQFMKTNHKSLNTATTPIVRAISNKLEPTVISQDSYPIFRSDTLEKPILRPEGAFFATIRTGMTILKDIIPAGPWGMQLRGICESHEDFGIGLANALKSSNGKNYVSLYMEFFQSVKKGMVVDHQFLQPFDLSDRAFNFYNESFFTGTDFQFNYGKLLDVVPSIGVQWHVAKIILDGVEVESLNDLTEDKLFDYGIVSDTETAIKGGAGTPSESPTAMKDLRFELGTLNADGSYSTDFLNFDISGAIAPPNEVVYSWQTRISTGKPTPPFGPPNPPVRFFTDSKNVSPNWKYIRVSDLFPAYGQTIHEAIGQVKKFKKQVESIAKEIDAYILFLERQIRAIQILNDQIQTLIAFFSKGLNAAGLYSAQFNGDGVGDFKKKLGNLKVIQTAKNKVHEISLETVESETISTDPFTGLEKKEIRKVLRPSITEQEIEPDGIPKKLSELDNLKYSGAVVFFAQGPDIEKFDKFMNSFNGLSTLGKGFLANMFNKEDNIAQKIEPYVWEIQGQDKDDNWIEIEKLAQISDEGTIRIKFTNDANELKKSDRDVINKQMEKSVDFSPKIRIPTFTNSDTLTSENDPIVLYHGTYGPSSTGIGRSAFSADATFHQFARQPKTSFEASPPADEKGIFEREFYNVDLKTLKPMTRSGEFYKIIVQTSITNQEGQTLKDRKNLDIGFKINPVTVDFGELI